MRMLVSFAGGTGHFLPLVPLARAARALPGDVRARRAVDATATVARDVVAGWLVPDGAPR